MDQNATTTSLGIPVVLEAALSTLCLFSSIFVFFFEKANVYCRANAFQNIVLFYIFFLIFGVIFIIMMIVQSFTEFVMFAFLVLYLVLKIVQIVIACIFARSERFIGIPLFSKLILKRAQAAQ